MHRPPWHRGSPGPTRGSARTAAAESPLAAVRPRAARPVDSHCGRSERPLGPAWPPRPEGPKVRAAPGALILHFLAPRFSSSRSMGRSSCAIRASAEPVRRIGADARNINVAVYWIVYVSGTTGGASASGANEVGRAERGTPSLDAAIAQLPDGQRHAAADVGAPRAGPQRMTRRPPRPAERATDREVRVVEAVLVAGSEKAAAHRLDLSHSTVKPHPANARSRVGAETTAQLVWILAERLPASPRPTRELADCRLRCPTATSLRAHRLAYGPRSDRELHVRYRRS